MFVSKVAEKFECSIKGKYLDDLEKNKIQVKKEPIALYKKEKYAEN